MAGMFKIVQTIEKGLKQLTIVPSAWVQNNQLSWPKKGADKLIRNANSVPEENWFTMVYEIAEEELERMLENEDTEQEEIMQTKKRPRVMLSKTKSNQNDFNSLADELADECLVTHMYRVVHEAPLQKSEESLTVATEVIDTENLTYQILPNDENFSSLFGTQSVISLDPQLNEKIDKIIANQDIIIQNQRVIIDNFEHSASQENQLKIMQHLAKLEVVLDSMASNNLINNTCACKTANQNSSLTIKEDIFFDPIDTLAELEKLEGKLSNKTDMEEYVQKFSYVCGRKGSGNGISNCYILVDKIFSRKFITLCSWAGGARDGKEKFLSKFLKILLVYSSEW
ncbi:hypothetical protein NQ317_003846 [Molorchus minor]|uniref:DUF4806 domain-containing protein n=1 Tax=Molorchus minor TaxID=1323400 RepID=A0ABQ9ISY3_9CUCU|nr:hypothetical protein NQ317_003846 [Molorchus minor]